MKQTAPVTFCDLTGGGPQDGSRLAVCASRTLMRFAVIVAKIGWGPLDVKVSDRWVHAYVRISDDEFAYDGIRER